MVRIITFAIAGALLSCISGTAVAANRACEEFTATKRVYGPSDYNKFVSACGPVRTFRRTRGATAKRWADCVNRRADSENLEASDDWLKIMTACMFTEHH